ncbi:ShlB/FhaC/HecB family hemolysin secretion/activation protein [Roseococcus sp. SYP-B2431]|uniref:ShlB/FhaC/HecB family hemolysin secretion/activation protein n=1 Tax=Roseococcus sp. SYP-B2431 TaxID=2496640 RepID=UPI00103BAF53|nr:ShlB/FhaC/HecB family hemolysin secretion/activation protein [Roseococcus sp. SYP-B2431]TCH96337.1 ShlB/FhaC/HecB family hemolysin secretion/activation protein [Roseococcus sp. SYP-B2431]
MTRLPAIAMLALLVLQPGAALAQAGLGPRGFDTDRPDIAPPRPQGRTAIPPSDREVVRADLPDITIRDVAVTGEQLVERAVLASAAAPFAGRRLTREVINELSNAIAAAHREAGLALFGVVVPRQDFAQGVVIVRVIEGEVSEIAIEGDTEGADLRLTRAHAEALRGERPLRRATLERALLLMADIPGRRVTGRFEQLGEPGKVRLVLNMRRISLRYGLGFDNLGADFLGNVQITTGVTLNALLQEGDSTRFTVGFPVVDFERFTYFGFRHQQPVGTSGMTVSVNATHLKQRVTGTSNLKGETTTVSLQAAYPVIRTQIETLQVFGNFDVVDSRISVPLGRLADEATRVVRLGAVYGVANEAQTRGGSLAVILSQGIDGAGARQRLSFFYGGPAFTKVTAIANYTHALWGQRFVLRLRALGQYTEDRMPSTEFFTYGGVMFGRGFEAATLFGDRGISASATLAMPFKTVMDVDSLAAGRSEFLTRAIRGAEAYVFVDGGRAENLAPAPAPRGDRAASAGFGLGFPVGEETNLNLEVAVPFLRPHNREVDRGARFVAVFRRNF